jgi:hypothetical protein
MSMSDPKQSYIIDLGEALKRSVDECHSRDPSLSIQEQLAKAWSEGFSAGSLNENGVQKAVRDGHRMPAPPSNPYVKP